MLPPLPDRRAATPSLSAVVPMFNEGKNAGALLRLLHDQLAALAPRFEIAASQTLDNGRVLLDLRSAR